jgi:hypothetical protein
MFQDGGRLEEFAQLKSLYAVSGGGDGGRDQRIVEVFFGAQLFDREAVEKGDGHRAATFVAERGGSLQYYRQDDDRVVVFLHPPRTRSDDAKTTDPAYILDMIGKVHVLTGEGILRKHLRALGAFMEVYSIDGTPTLQDRVRVLWIEYTKMKIKPPAEDSAGLTTVERAVSGWGFRIWELVILAGLSGWLLSFVSWLFATVE